MQLALDTLPKYRLAGFGRSNWSECRLAAVENVDELGQLFARCRDERVPLAFRGAGRSYGDAALLSEGLVIDLTRMSQITHWDPTTGIIEAGPGLTIEGLWRHVLPDGYWPAVVPGTMRPTLGGCLAMNIHGKNNFHAGPIGEHVLDFDLMSIDGQRLRCSRTEHPELFHAAISGLGLLGAITRVRLQTKRVESSVLRVRAAAASSLTGMFELFEERLPTADYLVGWIDCTAGGGGLGRGQTHDAQYVPREEDPRGPEALKRRQTLPSTVLGVPGRWLPTLLRPFANRLGTRLINAAKYYHARWTASDQPFFQSHVEFAFLFDHIPNWDFGLAPRGLVQLQVFAPEAEAPLVFREILARSRAAGLPAYLGVMKRHRSDPFLLTHAVDGYSLALDYRLTRTNLQQLKSLLRELVDLVLEHGGKFYFAKDSILTPQDTLRVHGAETLERFFAHKRRLDPDCLIESELSRRVFAGVMGNAPAKLV
jgi:decaprenylphospho-beta-D-ribofuranose 2-oxidase